MQVTLYCDLQSEKPDLLNSCRASVFPTIDLQTQAAKAQDNSARTSLKCPDTPETWARRDRQTDRLGVIGQDKRPIGRPNSGVN